MYVVVEGETEMLCEIAPPSDQFWNFSDPCGVVAAMVCISPTFQVYVCGPLTDVPSTVTIKFAGDVVTVTCTV